ncbi:FAD-dependent monooxygenase [Haloferula sp. BvORR071]|uniref:FAD-dependent monooxygenase n=1 Tax=Haloferula sp. BvORR071 TaxID=1396141 RepID=UPI000550D6EE|nr:FAD-dependent monooxygenase [Haloferula sp. BvORR071]
MRGPILIIGGGIGGLTAAIALRAEGHEVAVYERAPELREVGAAISVMANATRVLKHYGLLPLLLEHGEPIAAGIIQPNDGKPLKPPIEIDTGVPGVLIHRADLHDTLLSAVPRERIHLDKELKWVTQDEDSVTAIFADGTEARGSLLIAADGLNSAARRMLINDGPPIYRGYQCWRGVNPDAKLDIVAEVLGHGVRMGLIPMGRRGAAWWFCANEAEHQSDEPEGSKTKILRLLEGWHSSARDLVAGTPEPAISKNAIYDRPAKRGWSKGRAILIGDAAHPTTPNLGQGGGMAIEDAAMLARCLKHFPDHGTAFRRFEELRFPRVKKIVDRSRVWGAMGQWSNPVACGFRNLLLAKMPSKGLAKDLIEMMNYDPFAVKLDS